LSEIKAFLLAFAVYRACVYREMGVFFMRALFFVYRKFESIRLLSPETFVKTFKNGVLRLLLLEVKEKDIFVT
jgi:hypothetical protein